MVQKLHWVVLKIYSWKTERLCNQKNDKNEKKKLFSACFGYLSGAIIKYITKYFLT